MVSEKRLQHVPVPIFRALQSACINWLVTETNGAELTATVTTSLSANAVICWECCHDYNDATDHAIVVASLAPALSSAPLFSSHFGTLLSWSKASSWPSPLEVHLAIRHFQFQVYPPVINHGKLGNPLVLEVLMGNSSINGGFSIAMHSPGLCTACRCQAVSLHGSHTRCCHWRGCPHLSKTVCTGTPDLSLTMNRWFRSFLDFITPPTVLRNNTCFAQKCPMGVECM